MKVGRDATGRTGQTRAGRLGEIEMHAVHSAVRDAAGRSSRRVSSCAGLEKTGEEEGRRKICLPSRRVRSSTFRRRNVRLARETRTDPYGIEN